MNDAQEKIQTLKSLKFNHARGQLTWKNYMEKYRCENVCELGVDRGFNFVLMIDHQPKLAVAVDPWMVDGNPANINCISQNKMDGRYSKFKLRIKSKPFVKIYRDFSYNVVKEFEDEFFDFIFIDAEHSYEGVARDISDWYPKVKEGGVLCGHDYVEFTAKGELGEYDFGVIKAVDEFVEKNNIKTFSVIPPTTWAIIKERKI